MRQSHTFRDQELPELTDYYCVAAHRTAIARRAKLRKLVRFSKLRDAVIERIHHETIYRFAYSEDGQEIERRCYGRRFGPEVSILHRPDTIAKRKQFVHWECDLVQFRKKFGKTNMTSLVELVSRFTVLMRNNDRQSKPIMEGLIGALGSLPHHARRIYNL